MHETKFEVYYKEKYFMATQNKRSYFFSLLAGMLMLTSFCMYSCSGSGSADQKKDSSAAAMDSTSKMSPDTSKMSTDTTKMKTDTAGKGGQATPTGH